MKTSLERIPTRAFLIITMLVAACLYLINLRDTTVFIADIARDTTRALELWKFKELTLIGPPASFGQSGTKQIFFGSFSLYLGMIGLILGMFDPVAANYIGVALFLAAIPVLYFFLRSQVKSEPGSRLGVLLYAISPLTVTHARFFWNANFLIPFAIFVAYCANKKKYFWAGLLIGMMINFHYISFIYGMGYMFYLLLNKRYKAAMLVCVGVIIACAPLIVFEIRNNFYLSHALLFNISHSTGSLLTLIGRLLQSIILLPFTFVGIIPAEISYPTFLSVTTSDFAYNARYLFPIYPLLIAGAVKILMKMKASVILMIVIVCMFATSIRIVLHKPTAHEYISLNTIEKIAHAIVIDEPQAPYNITENIIGDARAISYRYFLLRDAAVQPEAVEAYGSLDRLYVVSPSKSKIYDENRWEFTATPNLALVKDTPIDGMHLYTFQRALEK